MERMSATTRLLVIFICFALCSFKVVAAAGYIQNGIQDAKEFSSLSFAPTAQKNIQALKASQSKQPLNHLFATSHVLGDLNELNICSIYIPILVLILSPKIISLQQDFAPFPAFKPPRLTA